ncbi:MAG TPA: lyase family protein [Burkholderiales bacterium]|nr:lyase family protein [Burkholderiales bacterium]
MAGLALTYSDEACAAALSDEALLQAMARFEGALAQASAGAGLVSVQDAAVIAKTCANATFDASAIALEARTAGTMVVPFLKQLRAQVAAVSPRAAEQLHAGATSQDVVDTALVLCLKPASTRVLALSAALGDAAAQLAQRHAGTRCMARTLLQPALPVTFGWKAAVWLSAIARCHGGFRAAAHSVRSLQFGGPEGTLSGLGAKALQVEAAIAQALGLAVAPTPWHSVRDGFARLGAEAAMLAGTAGTVARDISLLMQPEIDELAEPAGAGRGGSSSMPHKRNPAGSLLALEAALRVPGLAATLLNQLGPELDRGLGQWQSQWMTLRDLLGATSSALAAMGEVLGGLEVREEVMGRNLPPPGDDAAARAMIGRALEAWKAARAT